MEKQQGFTLLELLVVITIIAASAMIVISYLPENESGKTLMKDIQALTDRGRDKAFNENRLVGISLGQHRAKLLVWGKLRASSEAPSWHEISEGAEEEELILPKEFQIRFNDELLPYSPPMLPQIIFSPGGEMTEFTLTVVDNHNDYVEALYSQGGQLFTEKK